MFRVEQHIWRTTDGDLVESGHPDAAFLAYAAGDEVTDDIAKKDGLHRFAKAQPKPADKAVPRPADKSGSRSAKAADAR